MGFLDTCIERNKRCVRVMFLDACIERIKRCVRVLALASGFSCVCALVAVAGLYFEFDLDRFMLSTASKLVVFQKRDEAFFIGFFSMTASIAANCNSER